MAPLAESISFLLGFGERLLTEVKKLAPKDVKIKVGPGRVPVVHVAELRQV